nr:hypothetical protein CFP56_63960 [Quercus suber]
MIDSVSDDDHIAANPEPCILHPGVPDENLMYGIQFIQNALKSWAHQRMQNVLAEHTMKQWHEQQALQNDRRGRPRKFNYEAHQQELNAAVHMSLANQPEGRAILAFHEVLQCGALQVNGILPSEMARAMKHLYMQIDHLINKGPRTEPPFVCMSYGAQQAAHRYRLQRITEDVAKMQEDLGLQQRFGQQDLAQAKGSTVPNQRNFVQGQQGFPSHLDRRPGSYPQGSQLDQAGHSSVNPIVVGSQPSDFSTTASSILPGEGRLRNTPTAQHRHAANDRNAASQSESILQIASQTKGIHVFGRQMERALIEGTGLLTRSGKQMRFSFSPENEQALRVFGPGAFPNGDHTASSLPNGGSRAAKPAAQNLDAPESTVNPRATATDSADRPLLRPRSTKSEDFTVIKNTQAHSANTLLGTSAEVKLSADHDNIIVAAAPKSTGFTAINTPRRPSEPGQVESSTAHPSSHVAECRPPGSVYAARQMGTVPDLASRYPHPGAVIVDR